MADHELTPMTTETLVSEIYAQTGPLCVRVSPSLQRLAMVILGDPVIPVKTLDGETMMIPDPRRTAVRILVDTGLAPGEWRVEDASKETAHA